MGDPALLERAADRLASRILGSGRAATTRHFASIEAASRLTEESMVTRSPGALCRVRRTSGGVTIELAGNFVSGPSRLERALRFVAAAECFRVGDLRGELTAEDRTDLASRMMSEGLL